LDDVHDPGIVCGDHGDDLYVGDVSDHDRQTANTNIDSFSFDLLVIFNERRDVLFMAAMADVKGLLDAGM
jgi:hypothetical protein